MGDAGQGSSSSTTAQAGSTAPSGSASAVQGTPLSDPQMLTLARLTAMYVTGALPVKEKAGKREKNKGTALAAQSTEWDYESPLDFGHDNFTVRECNEVAGYPYPEEGQFCGVISIDDESRALLDAEFAEGKRNLSRR
jgi:hypothetical protein